MVAARRLRKSYLENKKYDIEDEFFNDLEIDSKKNKKEVNSEENIKNSFFHKIKQKILIKFSIVIFITFIVLTVKLTMYDRIKDNKYFNILKNEYSRNLEKTDVVNVMNKIISSNYIKIILGDRYENYMNNFNEIIIPKYYDFSVRNFFNVVKTKSIKEVENQEVAYLYDIKSSNNNKEQNDVVEKIDINDNLRTLYEKGIDIIKPIEGTVTSEFGQREIVFDEATKNHTGIDIGAKYDTDIHSCSSGKVIKVEENDKYYGNYVVIENNGVTFKYAHMNKILVTNEQDINQNDIVGLVGSTGYSTGPHLHLEISIDGNLINPRDVLEF